MNFYLGNAIRCFECSSQNDSNCADTFSNSSIRLMDCTQKHVYDLTPIESCLKIKHKGKILAFERSFEMITY